MSLSEFNNNNEIQALELVKTFFSFAYVSCQPKTRTVGGHISLKGQQRCQCKIKL